MAVAARVGEALEDQQADALGPAGAVGRGGERLAAPVGGEAALAAELDEQRGSGEDRHPTGKRQLALAPAQRLPGEVHRDQRGGAGGIHRDRRALEPERVGDPAGGDACRAAGQPVALQLLGQAVAAFVGRRGRAAEDPGRRPAHRLRVDPGVLQRLPGGFQQQPLLGVHRQRLARRDREELGVEAGRAREEAAAAGVGGAGVLGVGVVEALQVPAAISGEAGDRVAARRQQLPEAGRRVGAGEAAAHADDRDRLLAADHGDAAPRVRAGRPFGLAPQEGRQLQWGRVVEDDRRAEPQPGQPGEPLAQLHRPQRVEAGVLEGAPRRQVPRRLVPQHQGRLGPHQVDHQLLALPLRSRRQSLRQRTARRRRHLGALRLREAGFPPLGEPGPEPVAAALESVGGEVDQPRAMGREQRRPLDCDAVAVGLGERGEEAIRPALAAAQRADRGDALLGAGGLDRLRQRHRQHRVGADLDEGAVPVGDQGASGPLELHRLAQVAVPVGGVEAAAVESLAGHRRVEGDLRLARPDRGQRLQHLFAQRLDVARVRGDRRRHPAGGDSVALAGGQQALDLGLAAGQGDRRRPVDRRQLDPLAPAREALPCLRLGQPDRDHRPLADQPGDRLAAQRRQQRRVLQSQRPGDAGRGDLPLGVADHRRRPHPAGLPQLRQPEGDGEEDRLHDVNPLQRGSAGGAFENIEQRPVEVRRQRLRALAQAPGEDRRGGEQLARHPLPLRALAGEDEGSPAGVGDPGDRVGAGLPRGEGTQTRQQPLAVAAEQRRPVLQGGPAAGQRKADVGQVEAGVGLQGGGEPSGLGGERRLAPGREQQRHAGGLQRPRRRLGRALLILFRRLLKDHVGVGAADPERGDAGAARVAIALPGPRLGQQLDRARRPVDQPGRLVYM